MKDHDLLFRRPPAETHLKTDVEAVVDDIRKRMPDLYDICAYARCYPHKLDYQRARLLRLAKDLELVSEHLQQWLDPDTQGPVTLDQEAVA